MKIEFLGYVDMLPSELRLLPFDDMLLLLEAKRERFNNWQKVVRFQTALIAEAFVGKGEGNRFVMGSWKLDDSDSGELTREQVKQLLLKRKLIDAEKRKKLKNG